MLKTYSAWNYGHTINEFNRWLNFTETGDELSAKLLVGSFTLGEFASEIARAMNEVAQDQEYTTTLDRTTGKITIIGGDEVNFTLNIDTGSQAEISCYSLAGFNGDDLSGSDSYEGDSRSGKLFIPQFKLQQYRDFEDDQSFLNSTKSVTPNAKAQVISYGKEKIMSCNITFQTNVTPQRVIRENENGVAELRDFMEYATAIGRMEFLRDYENTADFVKCILDSTQKDSKGTGFFLEEMISKGFAEYYETRLIKFREIP